jgi:predicted ATPase/class 3 adenylate cyclase
MITQLPAGRVTFAFTDVVGSTRAFDEFGDVYVAAVRKMHALIAETVGEHGGAVVSTEGDGAFLAFPTADQALAALCAIQDNLEQAARAVAGQPGTLVLRVRAGAHTGHATPVGGEYVSLAVHVAARVAASANAGQVVVSQSVQHDLDKPRGVELGRYRLKDIAEPVTLWRITGPDTPLRADLERVTNVARPRTSFIGRVDELAALRDLVDEPGIVTVTGPGGLGKTRLVTELCLAICDVLGGGAWLAELASLDDPDAIPGAVAAALGAESASGVDALIRELRRRGDTLLVLDNCEHVIEQVAELTVALTDACPRLRMICTSREALEVDGEQVLRLHPLSSRTDTAQPGEAERLFLERATAAGATVAPDQLDAVTRACRQLDGLPLALELAAARLSTVPVSELAEALEAQQVRLQRRAGLRHHRSLTDLVAWSVRLLQPGERVALQALSVFPGRFDAPAAKEVLAAVPGATAHSLPELTRRSLVDLDGDRYRLLTTIRSYAADELAADTELAAAAHRAQYEWALRGCPDPTELFTGFDDFDTMLAVLAAFNWGLDSGAGELGQLMRRLRYYSDRTGGNELIQQAAARVLTRPLPQTSEEVMLQSIALAISVGMGWQLRAGSVDTDRVEQLVAAARSVADAPALYQAVGVAATTLSKVGLDDRAIEFAMEAVELTRREPSLAAFRGIQLGDLGVAYFAANDRKNAEKYMRQAVAIAEEVGDVPNVAVNRCNLAELLIDRGEFGEAIDQIRPVLQAAHFPPITKAIALAFVAEAENGLGHVDAARAIAPEAAAELGRMASLDSSLASYVDRLNRVLDAIRAS